MIFVDLMRLEIISGSGLFVAQRVKAVAAADEIIVAPGKILRQFKPCGKRLRVFSVLVMASGYFFKTGQLRILYNAFSVIDIISIF